MKHFITIEGYPKTYDRLLEFLRIAPDYFEAAFIKHTTDCKVCKGTGDVCDKGNCVECSDCAGKV